MQRADGHNGTVRESHRLHVPDRAVHAPKAWGGAGHVAESVVRTSGLVLSGREIQSGLENLQCGCGARASAVLDKVSGSTPLHDAAPAADDTGVDRRGRRDGRRMGEEPEKRAGREIGTLRYSAGTGTTVRTAGRVRRTGTTRPRTRTTTSGLAASVTAHGSMRSGVATAHQAGPVTSGQPASPASANTFSGPARRGVAKHRNAHPA